MYISAPSLLPRYLTKSTLITKGIDISFNRYKTESLVLLTILTIKHGNSPISQTTVALLNMTSQDNSIVDYQTELLSNNPAANWSPAQRDPALPPELSQNITNPITSQEFIRMRDDDDNVDAEIFQEEVVDNVNITQSDEIAGEDQKTANDYDNDIVGNSIFPTRQEHPGYVNSTDNTLVLGNSNEELSEPKTKKTRYVPDPFPSGATFNQLCLKEIHHSDIFTFCCNAAFSVNKIVGLKADHYKDKYNRTLACPCGNYKIRIICYDQTVPVEDRTFRMDPSFGFKALIGDEELFFLYHSEMGCSQCKCDKKAVPLQPFALVSMPLFHKWIAQTMHPLQKDYTYEDVKTKIVETTEFTIGFKKSVYSDIKYAVVNYLCKTISEEYKHIPTITNALLALNSTTVSSALQADSEHRFCRWFVGFPIAKYHGVLTQPVYIVDCFHSKCKMYSGRTFIFASRTGYGRTVIEAFAYIPNESAGHICWLVQMCWRHGMKLEDAIFTDQGPFLAAMNALNREFLVSFYTMLCLQHIFRNIHDGFGVLFKSNKDEEQIFRHTMDTASFCEDQLSFFQTIFDYLNTKILSCPAPHRHQ